jgi:hypothetical protein
MNKTPELTRRQAIIGTIIIAAMSFLIGFCLRGALYGQALIIERQGTNVLVSVPGNSVELHEFRGGAVWVHAGDPDAYGAWMSWTFPIEPDAAAVFFRAVHFDFQDNPLGL